jgi:tetratricopeptide (TPR) repeat protein
MGLVQVIYDFEKIQALPNRADGTFILLDAPRKTDHTLKAALPDGQLYATVGALANFAQAVGTGKLPSKAPSGDFMLAGGTPTMNSAIGYHKGFAIAITSNISGTAEKLANRITQFIDDKPVTPIPLPPALQLYDVFKKKGAQEFKTNTEELAKSVRRPYDDRFLNWFGYELKQAGKTEQAITIFFINTELFPKVANTWDSLAEAYYEKGDKENARKYYAKVLELDPQNPRAKDRSKE